MAGLPTSEANFWIPGFLAEFADGLLIPAGFRRPSRAKSARRHTEYGSQQITFWLFTRPSYARESFHLAAQIRFYMTSVMELSRRIFGDRVGPLRRDGLAGGVPFDFLRRDPSNMWLFRDQAELVDLGPSVSSAIRSAALPFLDMTDTMERFVSGPATERLRVEVVAAAMVLLGRHDDAISYLQANADRNPTAAAVLERHLAETTDD